MDYLGIHYDESKIQEARKSIAKAKSWLNNLFK